jgi:hypothetical protein
MSNKRRQFRRHLGKRHYRKLFILAVEGEKTEPQYFTMFNDQQSLIHVECIFKKHGSAPDKVLEQMRDCLKGKSLKKTDEAWLVVDKDHWSDEQLAQLNKWSQEQQNYGFALSNPKFEFWLLLHFEEGKRISNSRNCSKRLEKHLPNYDKGIDVRKFKREMIENAIQRARQRDNPPCTDWPKDIGTTVYKIVEKFIATTCKNTNRH